MLGGDLLLPRITPIIAVWWTEPDANPLQDFFTFLDSMKGGKDEILVLPGHDGPYRGINFRIDAAINEGRYLAGCRLMLSSRDSSPRLATSKMHAHLKLKAIEMAQKELGLKRYQVEKMTKEGIIGLINNSR